MFNHAQIDLNHSIQSQILTLGTEPPFFDLPLQLQYPCLCGSCAQFPETKNDPNRFALTYYGPERRPRSGRLPRPLPTTVRVTALRCNAVAGPTSPL